MRKTTSLVFVLIFTAFLLPVLASAQSPSDFDNPLRSGVIPDDPGAFVKDTDGKVIFKVLNTLISMVFYALMLLVILFLLMAAFNYLTAAGNPEKVEKAQKQILYAVITLVIAILARSIPFIVSNFVQDNV